MSGPHAEDEIYGMKPLYEMTSEEVDRWLNRHPWTELDPPRRGFHHQPPTTLPVMPYEDVRATLEAHRDNGTGYCGECGEMDPCGVRLWHEAKSRDLP